MSPRRRRDATPTPSAHFSAPKHRGDKNIRLLYSPTLATEFDKFVAVCENLCHYIRPLFFNRKLMIRFTQLEIKSIEARWLAVIFSRASEAEAAQL